MMGRMITGSERNPEALLDSGVWDNGNTTWELWRSSELPDPNLCTTVALVAVTSLALSRVVLAESRRGWGIIAGHIEPGETLDETVEREALEEGGFKVVRKRLFAYKKMHNIVETERSRLRRYPKISYMPCYVSVNEDDPLQLPTGEEIIQREALSMDNPEAQERLKPEDLVIVKEGLRTEYRRRGIKYNGKL